MAVRRPAKDQPAGFEWTPENQTWCDEQIKKYPQGRQASCVIPFLWRGQKQEGWISIPMMEAIARQLEMPYIRVYEVATFYTMFNLEPVGEYFVQLCGTTPCMLRGAQELREVCKKESARKAKSAKTASSHGLRWNASAPVRTLLWCKSQRKRAIIIMRT